MAKYQKIGVLPNFVSQEIINSQPVRRKFFGAKITPPIRGEKMPLKKMDYVHFLV